MTSALELAVFFVFAIATVGFSLGVVLAKRAWHSALSLGGALFGIAVNYVLLNADFVAAMQVLVYVGGVLVLLAFAVMLTEREREVAT